MCVCVCIFHILQCSGHFDIYYAASVSGVSHSVLLSGINYAFNVILVGVRIPYLLFYVHWAEGGLRLYVIQSIWITGIYTVTFYSTCEANFWFFLFFISEMYFCKLEFLTLSVEYNRDCSMLIIPICISSVSRTIYVNAVHSTIIDREERVR